MKIFVAHYSKLVERKKFIVEQFARYGITDYEFVEKYDKDELTEQDLSLFTSRCKKSELSLFLKHIYIYRDIAENYDDALIFEDDVILHPNFNELFTQYMEELPKDYDILYLGDGCRLHIEKDKIQENKHIYDSNHYSKCTDSYVVSKKCAIALCNLIQKDGAAQKRIAMPVDHWLNYAGIQNDLHTYWCEPTIVTQGSQHSRVFQTSLI